jgi:hypothetical protein
MWSRTYGGTALAYTTVMTVMENLTARAVRPRLAEVVGRVSG